MTKSKKQVVEQEEMKLLKKELDAELSKFEAAVEEIEAYAQRLEKEMDELVESVTAQLQDQELEPS